MAPAEKKEANSMFARVLLPTALFVGVYSVYVYTLYPSVPGGDSGELLAEACQLGVAHPPGYPLFVLVTRAWMDLLSPLGGSPAWRANLMSALFDAVAAVCVYHSVLILARLRGDIHGHWAALAAGALFATSPLIWLYAVGAEVFSMNNMFAALLVFLTLRYAETKSFHTMLVGAFVCGLALCNQHTAVLFELPLIGWILWTNRKRITVLKFFSLVVVGLVGMTPYTFMWYTDAYRPQPGSWGDSSSFEGFLRHFLRKDYGTLKLYSRDGDTAGAIERTALFLKDFATVEAPFGLSLVSLLGVVICVLDSRRRSVDSEDDVVNTGSAPAMLIGTLSFYLGVFHFLSNMPLDDELLYGVHARFWQQPGIILFVMLGVGLSFLMSFATTNDTVPKKTPKLRKGLKGRLRPGAPANKADPPQGRGVVESLPAAVTFLLIAMQIAGSFPVSNMRDNDYMGRYARAMLEPLPHGAVFISGYDMQWAAGRYMQTCEHVRPDINLLNAPVMSYDWFSTHRRFYPNVTFPGSHMSIRVGDTLQPFHLNHFLDANVDDIPVVHAGPYAGMPGTVKPDGFEFDPWGIVSRIRRTSDNKQKVGDVSLLEDYVAAWKHARTELPVLPSENRFDRTTWESTVRLDVEDKQVSFGEFLLDEAVSFDPPNARLILQAASILEEAFDVDRLRRTSLYKNLGLAYAKLVQAKLKIPDDVALPEFDGVRGVNQGKYTREEWQKAVSVRVLVVWEEFVSRPDAKSDPSYPAIANVVQTLRKAAGR